VFTLDKRLENDTFLIKDFESFQIRLMDIEEIFWLVLIPKKPNLIELSDLDMIERNKLINFTIDLGDQLKSNQQYDKINIGMLGNIVSQLHLHLVLRNKDDPAWPGPVWGKNNLRVLNQKTLDFRKTLIKKIVNKK